MSELLFNLITFLFFLSVGYTIMILIYVSEIYDELKKDRKAKA